MVKRTQLKTSKDVLRQENPQAQRGSLWKCPWKWTIQLEHFELLHQSSHSVQCAFRSRTVLLSRWRKCGKIDIYSVREVSKQTNLLFLALREPSRVDVRKRWGVPASRIAPGSDIHRCNLLSRSTAAARRGRQQRNSMDTSRAVDNWIRSSCAGIWNKSSRGFI